MLPEEKSRSVKKIFIPDSFEVGGWWRAIKIIFELTDTSLKNLFTQHSEQIAFVIEESCSQQVQTEPTHFSIFCLKCQYSLRIVLTTLPEKSYVEVLTSSTANPSWAKMIALDPSLVPKNSGFEIQIHNGLSRQPPLVQKSTKWAHPKPGLSKPIIAKKLRYSWGEKRKWVEHTESNKAVSKIFSCPKPNHHKNLWQWRPKRKATLSPTRPRVANPEPLKDKFPRTSVSPQIPSQPETIINEVFAP